MLYVSFLSLAGGRFTLVLVSPPPPRRNNLLFIEAFQLFEMWMGYCPLRPLKKKQPSGTMLQHLFASKMLVLHNFLSDWTQQNIRMWTKSWWFHSASPSRCPVSQEHLAKKTFLSRAQSPSSWSCLSDLLQPSKRMCPRMEILSETPPSHLDLVRVMFS